MVESQDRGKDAQKRLAPATFSAHTASHHARVTTRPRPFWSRTSMRESPATLGAGSATCTSKNFAAALPHSSFFHTKKYGLHKARFRQNVVTSRPLRACSQTSFRHFAQAFFVRLVMSQPCYATQSFTRWGSFSAHHLLDSGSGI